MGQVEAACVAAVQQCTASATFAREAAEGAGPRAWPSHSQGEDDPLSDMGTESVSFISLAPVEEEPQAVQRAMALRM